MAVRADEHAFGGFLAQHVERSGQPATPELKALGARIDVVKSERGHAPVIATTTAPAARLGDEDLLCATAPTRHGIQPAARARRAAVIVDDVLPLAVDRADREDPRVSCATA